MESTSPGTMSFGDLLRQHRRAANLTQEALAERAGISVRGISDLERGARSHPYRETVNLLTAALGLSGADRAAFLRAARRPSRVPSGRHSLRLPRSLPRPTSSLVGREREIAEITHLLRDDGTRLVTLTGPGGVGKSRLAVAVAERLEVLFPEGTAFVDLAPVRQAAAVVAAIAAALGLRDAPLLGGERWTFHLGDGRSLLVLDNFEHVLAGAHVVNELLQEGSNVKVLVTSREALHLRGEQTFLVAPLASPAPGQTGLPSLARSPALQLFVDRAAEVDAHFRLTDENVSAIAAICQRLDGLPLAIELAAARVNVLSPMEVLARLDPALPLLSGGPRDAPARQQTLRDAIAWSYDLLDPGEKMLFRRLAVFAGGFTLEAAEAVTPPVFAGLTSLVAKSLIGRAENAADSRFSMLATLREFAWEELRNEEPEPNAYTRAHAMYFLALAEQAREGLTSDEQETWLARLDREEANLQAALAWCVEREPAETTLRLARALWRYWSLRGRLSEGRLWLERALAQPGAESVPTEVRADACNALGNLLADAGAFGAASQEYERALALREGLGDLAGIAGTLNNLGAIALRLGDLERAQSLHERSLRLRCDLGDRFGEALSLSNLGDVALAGGDFARARELQAESWQLREEIGDASGIAYSMYNLGEAARREGNGADAARWLRESLERFEAMGDRAGRAHAEWSLSRLATEEGNAATAADLLQSSLAARLEIGDRWGVLEAIEAVGILALGIGDVERGARLVGMARRERKAQAMPLLPSLRDEFDRALGGALTTIGPTSLDAMIAEPEFPERSVALAREVLESILDDADERLADHE